MASLEKITKQDSKNSSKPHPPKPKKMIHRWTKAMAWRHLWSTDRFARWCRSIEYGSWLDQWHASLLLKPLSLNPCFVSIRLKKRGSFKPPGKCLKRRLLPRMKPPLGLIRKTIGYLPSPLLISFRSDCKFKRYLCCVSLKIRMYYSLITGLNVI